MLGVKGNNRRGMNRKLALSAYESLGLPTLGMAEALSAWAKSRLDMNALRPVPRDELHRDFLTWASRDKRIPEDERGLLLQLPVAVTRAYFESLRDGRGVPIRKAGGRVFYGRIGLKESLVAADVLPVDDDGLQGLINEQKGIVTRLEGIRSDIDRAIDGAWRVLVSLGVERPAPPLPVEAKEPEPYGKIATDGLGIISRWFDARCEQAGANRYIAATAAYKDYVDWPWNLEEKQMGLDAFVELMRGAGIRIDDDSEDGLSIFGVAIRKNA